MTKCDVHMRRLHVTNSCDTFYVTICDDFYVTICDDLYVTICDDCYDNFYVMKCDKRDSYNVQAYNLYSQYQCMSSIMATCVINAYLFPPFSGTK